MNKEREHRRIWSEEEDNILRTFVEHSMISGKPKWKEISEKLNEALKLEFQRNPKQCRSRWFNSLATDEKEEDVWTLEDDVTLIQACKKHGHRWSQLSKEFNRKVNDNKLKNHFYSTVRKIVRIINTLIKDEKKTYKENIKNNLTKHFTDNEHFIFKEISKLRTFESKLLSKVFSLIDSKQEYKYEAKSNLQISHVKTVNNEILDYMEDYVTQTNQFPKMKVLEMIVKVMQINKTIKTKYTREIKLSLQNEEEIQRKNEIKNKINRKINNIVKKELNNKIIPDKKTKEEIIKKIGGDNKVLKGLIKPINTRRIIRKQTTNINTTIINNKIGKEDLTIHFENSSKNSENENEQPKQQIEHQKYQNFNKLTQNTSDDFNQFPLSFQFNYAQSQFNTQHPNHTNHTNLQSSLNLSQNGASHQSTPDEAHFESIFGFNNSFNQIINQHSNHNINPNNNNQNQQYNDLQNSSFIFQQIPFNYQTNDKEKNELEVKNDNMGRVDGQNDNMSIRSYQNDREISIKDESMELSHNRPQFINAKLQDSSRLEEEEFGNIFSVKINQPNSQSENPFNSNFLNEIPLFLSSNNQNHSANLQQNPIFAKELNPFFPQHKLTHSQGYFSFEQPIVPIEKSKIEEEIGICRSNPMLVIESEVERRDMRERLGSSHAYSGNIQFDEGPISKFEGLFASYDYQCSEKPSEQSPCSRNRLFELMPTINPFGGNLCPIFTENFIETSRPYSSSNEHGNSGKFDMMESMPIGAALGFEGGIVEGEVALGEGMWRSCSFAGEEGSEKIKGGRKRSSISGKSVSAKEW